MPATPLSTIMGRRLRKFPLLAILFSSLATADVLPQISVGDGLIWLRWLEQTEAGCLWAEPSALPPTGWVDLRDYKKLAETTQGHQTLNDKQFNFCFSGYAPVYRVSPNQGRATRPLYDGALWLAVGGWKIIGRVPVGALCEPDVIRNPAYRWTQDETKLKGIAVCG